MELLHHLRSIRDRWRTGVVVALLIAAAVAAVTLLQTPEYQATNRVFVQAQAGSDVTDLNGGVDFASQQISSYADLATTPFVLDEVIADVGLDTSAAALAKDITVTVPEGTLIIEITATATDPGTAAAIADSTAGNLRDRVSSFASDGSAASIELRVVSPAVVPATPSSPDVLRNAVLGGMLAVVAGVGAALVRSLLNTRVTGVDDLRGAKGRTVLGIIPASRSGEDAARVLIDRPHGAAAEAYRELRTNLQFVKLAEGRPSVLVTSSLAGEGKSTCSVNLAQVMAGSGARVLLVDADLRSPSVHTALGLEGGAGLTTVLIGRADLPDVTQPGGTPGLDVITSGAVPPNPSELLGSAAMEDVLREAARRYDVIVVDAPPLLPVTDAAVLSQVVGGVLVVAQNERVRRSDLERAMAKLETVEAKVVGMVLNRVRGISGGRYVYAGAGAESGTPVHDETPVDAGAPVDPSDLVTGPEPGPRSFPVPAEPPAPSAHAARRRAGVRAAAGAPLGGTRTPPGDG